LVERGLRHGEVSFPGGHLEIKGEAACHLWAAASGRYQQVSGADWGER
jgi:hypothetical protein